MGGKVRGAPAVFYVILGPTIIKTLQSQGYSFLTIPEVVEQYEAERKAVDAGASKG